MCGQTKKKKKNNYKIDYCHNPKCNGYICNRLSNGIIIFEIVNPLRSLAHKLNLSTNPYFYKRNIFV